MHYICSETVKVVCIILVVVVRPCFRACSLCRVQTWNDGQRKQERVPHTFQRRHQRQQAWQWLSQTRRKWKAVRGGGLKSGLQGCNNWRQYSVWANQMHRRAWAKLPAHEGWHWDELIWQDCGLAWPRGLSALMLCSIFHCGIFDSYYTASGFPAPEKPTRICEKTNKDTNMWLSVKYMC